MMLRSSVCGCTLRCSTSDVATLHFTDSDKKLAFNAEAMLEKGTLGDLLTDEGPESRVAKNMLDLPLGGSPVPPIVPRFQDILSNMFTRHSVKHLVALKNMRDITSCGTAAMQNTVSWIHCDDKGFSTSIWV